MPVLVLADTLVYIVIDHHTERMGVGTVCADTSRTSAEMHSTPEANRCATRNRLRGHITY